MCVYNLDIENAFTVDVFTDCSFPRWVPVVLSEKAAPPRFFLHLIIVF